MSWFYVNVSWPRTAFLPTRLVSESTESINASSSAGLILGSMSLGVCHHRPMLFQRSPVTLTIQVCFLGLVNRTAFSSAGFQSGSTESRNVLPSTSLDSMFPGDPDYRGSRFKSYFS